MTLLTTAPGETSLLTLLSSLKVHLSQETYVFITLPPSTSPPSSLAPLMTFHEREGLSLIASLSSAEEHKLSYTFPSRMITLDIQSSLEAVGFMATISRKLMEKGIGTNPIAGYWRDYIFVKEDRAEEAVNAIEEMVEDAKETVGTEEGEEDGEAKEGGGS